VENEWSNHQSDRDSSARLRDVKSKSPEKSRGLAEVDAGRYLKAGKAINDMR